MLCTTVYSIYCRYFNKISGSTCYKKSHKDTTTMLKKFSITAKDKNDCHAPNSVYSHYEKKSYFSSQIRRDKKTVPFYQNQL